MKKLICILSAVIVLVAGCSEKNTVNSATRDIFAMDTYMSLKAYGENAETALSLAQDEIIRLESLLSVTNEKSDVSAINQSNGHTVSVSEDTVKIIEKAIEIGNQTNGALDITIYPVLKEWGFTTGNYSIPSPDVLNQYLKYVDYSQVITNGNSVTVPENFQIDLGALAKGYTSDSVMNLLKDNNIDSAVVSLGGNVQTLGKKQDGSLWKVGIINPFSPDTSMGVIEVSDKAVITSGNYERYFIGDDGNRYCHIIDSSDGYPADNGLVSVTIIGESGLICDALSTALFVYGKENAVKYWQEHNDFDMILVSDDMTITITEGIEKTFQNMSEMQTEVIRRK
ncbi:MAG: FAD:protein FMN transferase [Ruminococcus sp.]